MIVGSSNQEHPSRKLGGLICLFHLSSESLYWSITFRSSWKPTIFHGPVCCCFPNLSPTSVQKSVHSVGKSRRTNGRCIVFFFFFFFRSSSLARFVGRIQYIYYIWALRFFGGLVPTSDHPAAALGVLLRAGVKFFLFFFFYFTIWNWKGPTIVGWSNGF